MPEAARMADPTQHGIPLTPGPGSVDVLIGFMPAWRALPASVGAAVEEASKAVDQFMKTPVLTPANAAPKIAKISKGLTESGAKAAAEGNPAATGAAAGGLAALNATNVSLTSTWTSASSVPGGQPAANQAYTLGIQAAAAAASAATFAAVGAMADTHICPIPVPIPPHGPGMVTKGSSGVIINNLPAARKGDKVMEAAGGADPIAMGCPTVKIGDDGGGGGGGGGGSGAGGSSASASGENSDPAYSDLQSEADEGEPSAIECFVLGCECSNSACGEAFQDASDSGTPLVDRDSGGCAGPPDTAERIVGPGVYKIGIELVGENGEGIAGERFMLKTPDCRTIEGRLGAEGRILIDGLEQAGPCDIGFPDLDQSAVEDIV